MSKTLSTREQLNCLIMALETNIEEMKTYQAVCEKGMKGVLPESSIVYVHNHGMKAGMQYAEEIIRRTLEAAKRQRDGWSE